MYLFFHWGEINGRIYYDYYIGVKYNFSSLKGAKIPLSAMGESKWQRRSWKTQNLQVCVCKFSRSLSEYRQTVQKTDALARMCVCYCLCS